MPTEQSFDGDDDDDGSCAALYGSLSRLRGNSREGEEVSVPPPLTPCVHGGYGKAVVGIEAVASGKKAAYG